MPTLIALLSLIPGFERELRLLPLLLRAGHTCVDIGSSLGVYALPMAVLVGATGRVVAFEPRRRAARRLTLVASELGVQHLQVKAAAVSRKPGSASLVVPHRRWRVPGRAYLADGTVSDELDDRLRPGTPVSVPVVTLDTVRADLDRRIDFIKCDVEGAELDVFHGGKDVLTNDRPVVLCEVEDRHTRRYGHAATAVLDHLKDLDYTHLPLTSTSGEARNHLFVPAERQDMTPRPPTR